MTERGEKISSAGRTITGIVYGTFFCLVLLFIIYAIARALWP
jgi:hypothetical protein